MPLINHTKKEINAKLVYFGPAAAGKAANLNYIYGKLKESSRGKFKSMDLQKDRMLFFDFLPSTQGTVNGYSIRFHVYTISGKASQDSSWKMVLKGVDGLVFVADSRPECMAANAESLKVLNACLASHRKSLSDTPCVLECNKQDVPQAVAAEQMRRALNLDDFQVFPAVAAKGDGVLEAIFGVVKMVLKNIRAAGIDVGEQSEQIPRVAQENPVDDGTTENVQSTAQVTEPPLTAFGAEAVRDEPVVQVEGAPEVVKGAVLLPLAIKCGDQTKKITLSISVMPSDD